MKRAVVIGLLSAQALITGCAGTGSAEPTAKGLFDRFVDEAYGGKGVEAYPSVTMNGTLIIEDFGIEGPMTTKQMAPNYIINEMEVMGMQMTQGCNKDKCWEQQPGQGPQELKGEPLAFMREMSDITRWENPEKYYERLEIVPSENEAEAENHAVRAVRADGSEDMYYFSKETGLMVGSQITADTTQGEITMTTRFNNYKEFDGAKFPAEMVQNTPMATIRIVYDDVSFEPLTEADFQME